MQFHLQFETEIADQEENFSLYKIMIHPGEVRAETTPYITLASFMLDEEREELLIKYLDKLSSTITPFRISFSDAAYVNLVTSLQAQINVVLKIDVRIQKKHLLKSFDAHLNDNADFSVEKLALLKRNSENVLEVCKEFYFF